MLIQNIIIITIIVVIITYYFYYYWLSHFEWFIDNYEVNYQGHEQQQSQATHISRCSSCHHHHLSCCCCDGGCGCRAGWVGLLSCRLPLFSLCWSKSKLCCVHSNSEHWNWLVGALQASQECHDMQSFQCKTQNIKNKKQKQITKHIPSNNVIEHMSLEITSAAWRQQSNKRQELHHHYKGCDKPQDSRRQTWEISSWWTASGVSHPCPPSSSLWTRLPGWD